MPSVYLILLSVFGQDEKICVKIADVFVQNLKILQTVTLSACIAHSIVPVLSNVGHAQEFQ